MKVVMSGGHFSPALSIIHELSADDKVYVLGRKYAFEGDSDLSFEYQVCKEYKIPFVVLDAARFQRKYTVYTLPSLFKFPFSIFQAYKAIKTIKPDVIMTFGSYLSLPVGIAGWLLYIPLVIHEQTQHAGLANKLLAHLAQKICISFESSRKYFPKNKIVITGNPIRKEVTRIIKTIDIPQNLPVIYITGGSSGSHFINTTIHPILSNLLTFSVVIHQTGDSQIYNDYSSLMHTKEKLPSKLSERYIVRKFIFPDEVGFVFSQADLVVSRGGINSISELLTLSKPSLIIPLPHGQYNEQLHNAQFIKKIGLGEYLEQDHTSPESLLHMIKIMLANKTSYMKKTSYSPFPEASKTIVSILQSFYAQNRENKEKKK